jgi:hypothetical protein
MQHDALGLAVLYASNLTFDRIDMSPIMLLSQLLVDGTFFTLVCPPKKENSSDVYPKRKIRLV